ncbi:alpha,alpha-trehalose-phosphate synthase (UDP-forming) [Acuticoccus mangrovi]|uniref:Trehalose-6-phosphate synthase n=1 Tax=Acuticoccus mangrovi TaxID=2796142 RepID=A0A934MI57_9HYPH|nr:trehalose-6-phosphate synthase [Acuticoccus mangrovi]MBJ3778408.1 trehalose-6-phosphate synthase [Acuticoccus mangrovi]
MTRIVIVSNRVGPLTDTGRAGGLAVALVDVLRERGGLWFGWSGEVSEDGTYSPLRLYEDGNVSTATIDVAQADYDEFYAGYSNRALWPTLHYRLDLTDFDRRLEEGYRRVNERFASRLVPLLRPDDIVWVHDYHFFFLGETLRAAGVENPIGFFLHIPFPVPEVLTALPNHKDIVKAMLAYDLVGFQTSQHLSGFERYLLEEVDGERLEDGSIAAMDRRVVADAFPIGIDGEAFSTFHETTEGRENFTLMRSELETRKQIVGVDRIDYSKGLPERFEAFERLLELYPEHKGEVSLLQIAPPSRSEVRAYTQIQRLLEGLSGRINGRFSDLDWTPIHFITRSFPRRALAGIYRASAVGLVTPLRDGMNLVAKEYIAAQDPEDPGVLVLSRFAGAAEEMREALIVNPYSIDELAEALRRAIQMPLEERKERWTALNAKVMTNTASNWSRRFLDRLVEIHTPAEADG